MAADCFKGEVDKELLAEVIAKRRKTRDKLIALESAAAAVRAARFALKPHDRSLMASCDELLSDIQAEIAHESRAGRCGCAADVTGFHTVRCAEIRRSIH